MKAPILAFCLVSCAMTPAPAARSDRELICHGPTENIPDDDPALERADPDARLGRDRFPQEPTLADKKVALAIDRNNDCDEGDRR